MLRFGFAIIQWLRIQVKDNGLTTATAYCEKWTFIAIRDHGMSGVFLVIFRGFVKVIQDGECLSYREDI